LNDNNFKKVISAAELVRLQWRPHGWLLWQMIPQGGITLLAGETASGKTFLGLDLALHLAAGRGKAWDMEIANSSWFIDDREKKADSSLLIADREKIADSSWLIADREKINDREKTDFPITYQLSPMSCLPRVRYFCGDADPNLIAERVLRLCRGYPNGKKGMGIEVPDALDLDFTAHQFNDPQSFAWLQKEVIRQGYQLLIFDGLAQYLPGMADGSASTVGAFLRGVRQLASQTGVTIVLIHQFNKRQAARNNKWGLPTSLGEERVRGSSELLAGVDSALLLSRPEAFMLEGRGRAALKVVKNRLGQAGARFNFSIVDGEPTNVDGVAHNTLCQGASEGLRSSLHLLFEHLAPEAQPKPRRLVDAALDGMMHILMEQDQREFTRAELTKLLQERMDLPGSRTLAEAFGMLGKEERVRVERKENGRRSYAWAQPGTGVIENLTYGLPPIMAFDITSSYLINRARVNIADLQLEKMQNQAKPTELIERLADFMKKIEEESNEQGS